MKKLLLFAFVLFFISCAHEKKSIIKEKSSIEEAKLVPGELYYETLTNILSKPIASNSSIDIIHFNFFTEKGHTLEIAKRLIELKSKNPKLKIRVILEGKKDSDQELGAATRNKLTQKLFAESGVEVHLVSGMKTSTHEGVLHSKAIRIGNMVLSGSTNLTNTSIDKNNEFNVFTSTRAIAQKVEQYADLLIEDSSKQVSLTANSDDISLITDDLFFNTAVNLIDEAKKDDSLDLTTYLFAIQSDDDTKSKSIFDKLVLASDRGAKVRVFLERSSDPKLNEKITKTNLEVAAKLSQQGISTVYLDKQDKISHLKIIKLSGKNTQKAIVGSTNLYARDFDENHQVNFVISNPKLVDQLGAYISHKIAYEGVKFSELSAQTPQPMIRFWRGYKMEETAPDKFKARLNEVLLPELATIGSGKGLLSYIPALHPTEKPSFIPDEVALIEYANAETYDAIRSTPRGSEYGPLHFSKDLFIKETSSGFKSGSSVLVKWNKQLKTTQAYQVGKTQLDLQNDNILLRTILRPESQSQEKFLESMTQKFEELNSKINSNNLKAAIVLVENDYALIFVDKKANQLIEFNHVDFMEDIKVIKKEASKFSIDFAEAASMQFDKTLISSEQLILPILEMFKK